MNHITETDFTFMDPPIGPNELGLIAHYRIIRQLGEGGMGMVFEADDTQLHRTVAVKVMKPEYALNYLVRERFLQEARAAAKLESDHIVTVYQVGLTKDVPFLVMPFLQGEPLEARLERDGSLTISESLLFAYQIASGLDVAHQNDFVHRDIKPANIWIEHHEKSKSLKRIKVLDFGLARNVNSDKKLTNVGMILGTPQYMSPEQTRGLTVDYRSDLFSLGVCLYRMLTGQFPFKGETTHACLVEVVYYHPPPPSTFNNLIGTDIDALVMDLLEKEPDRRPASAAVVMERIEPMLSEFSFNLSGSLSGTFKFPQKENAPSTDCELGKTQVIAVTENLIANAPIPEPMKQPAPVENNPFCDLESNPNLHSAVPLSSRTRMKQNEPNKIWKWLGLLGFRNRNPD